MIDNKTFLIDYIFEEQQNVKFDVLDIDSATQFDFIGAVEASIGQIFGAKNQILILDLKDSTNKKSGKIILRVEPVVSTNKFITMQIHCSGLHNTHFFFFNKSSPFLRFYRYKEQTSQNYLVHQTEVVEENLSPVFKKFEKELGKLAGGDELMPIKVEAWDYRSNGSHNYLGECKFSVNQVLNNEKEFSLFNAQKNKNAGKLVFDFVSAIEKPQFIDFIRGGTQLELMVAIDFTASNKDPMNVKSLHYNSKQSFSPYYKAIQSVSEILIHYDYDQLIPCFGFGGKPNLSYFNLDEVSHCFPLNRNEENPDCFQVKGILDSYLYSLQHVKLSGPTLFAPMIEKAMSISKSHQQMGVDKYVILLILTDGEIHDMDSTIDLIVNSWNLPLSIIIVGLGNANVYSLNNHN